MALVFWLLTAFGFCYVVGHARVSLGFRERLATVALAYKWIWLRWCVELMECPACLGFWVGLVGGLVWPWVLPAGFPFWTLGLATSASGYILGRATGWIHEE